MKNDARFLKFTQEFIVKIILTYNFRKNLNFKLLPVTYNLLTIALTASFVAVVGFPA